MTWFDNAEEVVLNRPMAQFGETDPDMATTTDCFSQAIFARFIMPAIDQQCLTIILKQAQEIIRNTDCDNPWAYNYGPVKAETCEVIIIPSFGVARLGLYKPYH